MKNKEEKIEENDINLNEPHIMVEIIEYEPNSVVIKTIIKKTTGNVSVISFDIGEGFVEKISPFDTFVQIIDGKAEIILDGVSHIMNTGEGMIIPAHISNIVKANEKFKMIQTVIKSGYEWSPILLSSFVWNYFVEEIESKRSLNIIGYKLV